MRRYFFSIIRGTKQDISSQFFRAFLFLLSFIYGWILSVRRFLYATHVFSPKHLPLPVISIGNLTWGGTGKTPFVMELANRVQFLGKNPAVISRGYGSDEWKEISANLPQVRVGIGKNRGRVASSLLAGGPVDVMICDDAFQHWALYRDWEIVLINAARPFGNGFLIPRGELRELPSELGKAQTIILTHGDQVSSDQLASLRGKLLSLAPKADLIEAIHEPLFFYRASSKEKRSLESFRGVSAIALSAIGSPESFVGNLRNLGLDVKKSFEFPDHHLFTEKDLADVRHDRDKSSIQITVTTEKDLYRGAESLVRVLDPWVLKVKMKIVKGDEIILKRLRSLLGIPVPKERVYA